MLYYFLILKDLSVETALNSETLLLGVAEADRTKLHRVYIFQQLKFLILKCIYNASSGHLTIVIAEL